MLLLLAGAAHAQVAPAPPSASQVTPRSLAPAAPVAQASRIDSATAIAIPEGAEKYRFTPSEVTVKDGYAELARETATLTKWLNGIEISVADFYKVAGAVQRLYAMRGYPLARVAVPEQQLEDGQPARLVAIDGYFEAIDTTQLPARIRRPVERTLAPLIGKKRLTFAELERRLTLAGQIPGAIVRSTIAAGSQPGGALLVIESGLRTVSGNVDFNDRASLAFERRDFSGRLTFNSLMSAGEQLYVFVSGDPFSQVAPFSEFSPKSIVGGGLIVPLDADGTSLNLEATRSVTQPLGGFFRTRNNFTRYSARLSYPVVLSRSETLALETSGELVDENQQLPDFGSFELSHDRYAIARFGPSYSQQLPGRSLAARMTISAGRSVAPLDALSSRISANRRFVRLEANVAVGTALPYGMSAAVEVRAAGILFGGVPNSELFGMDGPSALSPFTAGSLSADQGFTGRLTVRRPVDITPSFSVTPYAFGAVGAGTYSVPTPFDTTRAQAWGGGLEANFSPLHGPGVYAALEWGQQVSNGFFPDRSRFTLSMGARF